VKVTPPTRTVLYISIAAAVIALLVFSGTLSIAASPFWLMTFAYAVLLAGVLFYNF